MTQAQVFWTRAANMVWSSTCKPGRAMSRYRQKEQATYTHDILLQGYLQLALHSSRKKPMSYRPRRLKYVFGPVKLNPCGAGISWQAVAKISLLFVHRFLSHSALWNELPVDIHMTIYQGWREHPQLCLTFAFSVIDCIYVGDFGVLRLCQSSTPMGCHTVMGIYKQPSHSELTQTRRGFSLSIILKLKRVLPLHSQL